MTSPQTPVQPVARRALVSGRVQGVGYRYALRGTAQKLGISGWCRNLPDGRVEAYLWGKPDAIERVLAWMHEGPPQAVVNHVEVETQDAPEQEKGRFPTFEIRR